MSNPCLPAPNQDVFNSWLYPIRNQLNLRYDSRVQLLAVCETYWCTEVSHWFVNGQPLMKYINMNGVLADDGYTLVAHTIGQAVRAFKRGTNACILCDFTDRDFDNPSNIIFKGNTPSGMFVPFGNTPAPIAILFLTPGYSAHSSGSYWAMKLCGSPLCVNPRHYDIAPVGTPDTRFSVTPLLGQLHQVVNFNGGRMCFPSINQDIGGWIRGYPYPDLLFGFAQQGRGTVLPDEALITPGGEHWCDNPTCISPNHMSLRVDYRYCSDCRTRLSLENATPGWIKCSSCNPF